MRLRRKKWAPETIARHPGTALNLDSLNNLLSFPIWKLGREKVDFCLRWQRTIPLENILELR